ncbi:MAG: hypothetical protein WCP36_09940 [Methanomicrobiales archaeon]
MTSPIAIKIIHNGAKKSEVRKIRIGKIRIRLPRRINEILNISTIMAY